MMTWMFFLFGLVSLTGQIILLREILVIYHGTEISIGIFFAGWLAGIGLGAAAGALMAKNKTREFLPLFVWALSGLGFSVAVELLLIRSLPALLGTAPAEPAPLQGIMAAVPAGTLIPAFLTGFLFPVGCRSIQDADKRRVARLYASEAFGSLAGGLLFTFVLVRHLSPLSMAAVCMLLVGVTTVACAGSRRLKGCLVGGMVILAACAVLLSPLGKAMEEHSILLRWECLHPGLTLRQSTPTRHQQVEVAQLGRQVSLFGNGTIVSSFPDPHTADRLAALIMAQKPDARIILLLGGGIGSFPAALLQYPVDRIVVLEPDPEAMRIATGYLSKPDGDALKDPRVRTIFSDGRFWVNRTEPHAYDAVICMIPDPVSSFWSRFYTLEFFSAVSHALAPDGIFLTGVTSAENFWGADVASYAGSVYHTLRRVFPSVEGTPGDQTWFFASPKSGLLSLDPETLGRRYRTLEKKPFDPAAFFSMLQPERTAFVKKELDRSPVLINTDFAPVSSSLAMILWGRFSGNEGLAALNTIRRGGLTVYLIPLVFLFLGAVGFRARWGERDGASLKFQVLLAMAAIGMAAMGCQIVLIYGYQSLFGYVFERIGLLAAVFMVGLGTGGAAAGRTLDRLRPNPSLVAILLLFSLHCAVLSKVLQAAAQWDPVLIECLVFGLVLASGVLTGLGFPIATARHMEISGAAGESSGWTDAADHFGAAAGAFLTGTLVVPLLGMDRACLLMSGILLVPALQIVLERYFPLLEPSLARMRSVRKPSFPYVRLSWVLGTAVLAAMAWHLLIGPAGRAPTVTFSEETLRKISGSESFVFLEKPYPHYVGSSVGAPESTVTLSTAPVSADVRGYGGPINLILSVSKEGLIRGVGLVESRETPSYMRRIDPWLAHFQGRSVLAPLDSDVDALSGATITARAVTETLWRTGERIAKPILGLEQPSADPLSERSRWSALQDVRVWVVVLLLAFFLAAFHSHSRGLRTACLLVSLAVLGIVLNAPFTCLDAAALLRGEMPAPGTLWRNELFVAVVVISLLWGQAFCGFLCPFGALQEFLSLKRLRRHSSLAVERASRYTKFVLLAMLLCLFLVTDDTVWFSFSPLQQFFGWRMDEWVLALSLTCLVASVFFFRFWCRYLCPAGAFLALFNKIRLLRGIAPQPSPGRCDLGVRFPNDLDCIHCHRCLHREAPRPPATSEPVP